MKQTITNIYQANLNREDVGITDMYVKMALDGAAGEVNDARSCMKVLASLNLLNAAIKDPRWKDRLTYTFIKGNAAKLFDIVHEKPECMTKCSYDTQENVLFFEVNDIVFSFHYVPMTEKLSAFIGSNENTPIEWGGIRLQKIPVELFILAHSPEISFKE